jgi:hypothetical protein
MRNLRQAPRIASLVVAKYLTTKNCIAMKAAHAAENLKTPLSQLAPKLRHCGPA